MEQVDMKVSLGSNLKIYSIGSIKILSRSWDIVEKTLLHNSSPYVGALTPGFSYKNLISILLVRNFASGKQTVS